MGLSDFFKNFLGQSTLPTELHPFTGSPDSSADEEGTDRPGIEEFSVEIGSVYGEQAYLIQEEQRRIVVDPMRGDWEESKEELKEVWVENDRVYTETAFELYLSMRANKDDVKDICEFFEPPVLQLKQYMMLEESYHVSIYFSEFDVPYDEEQKRRAQLGNDFGELAMNLPSLCSAGYFDEGGLFRDIYHQVEPDHETFQDLFNDLVKHRPFVVFVEGDTGASEIYDMVIRKSLHLDELDLEVEYIHIRGIGSPEKINSVREMLEENHSGVSCTQMAHRGEMVLAIHNETL